MPKDTTSLKSLNANNLVAGTVPAAQLGSGAANTTTFLRGDSTWAPISTTPAGADTQVQFASSGAMGASSNLTFNYTTNTLTAPNLVGSGAGVTNLNASNFTTGTLNPIVVGGSGGTSSSFLRGDSTWQFMPSTLPAGPIDSVQFNNSGVFGGTSGFLFNGAAVPPAIQTAGILDLTAVSGPSLRYNNTSSVVKGGITAYGAPYGTLAVPCSCGRLTFDPSHAASNSSYSGASTGILYYLPVNGNFITLWNSDLNDFENIRIPDAGYQTGMSWATPNTMYDFFIINNLDGTAYLANSPAWTNSTTRASALSASVNGMLFLANNHCYRYVGTLFTQAAGQSADTPNLRLLWNAHNQVPKKLFAAYGLSSWTWTVPSGPTVYIRPANNDQPGSTLYFVVGATNTNMGTAGIPYCSVDSCTLYYSNINVSVLHGVALDWTNPTGWSNEVQSQCNTGGTMGMLWNKYVPTSLAPGLHFVTLMESIQNNSGANAGANFYGSNGNTAMSGFVWC